VPTYQYACTACDHRFEAVQSFADASLTECPACSGGLRKVFSSVGIVFKGSGFYRTDSRKGNATVGAKGEGGSSSSKESSTDSSSGNSGSSSSSSGSSGSGSSGSSSSSGSGSSGSSSTKAAAASS
jgi:putative FmdB family regulatory protein